MRFWITILAVLALLAGLTAGCGGDDDDSDSVTPATTTQKTFPGGAVITAYKCPDGEIYSAGADGCVAKRDGDNPCPEGEVLRPQKPAACFPQAQQE